MTTLLLLAVAYFGVVAAASVGATHFRRRARQVVSIMLPEARSQEERNLLEFTAASLNSMRMAPALTFSFLHGLVIPRRTLAHEGASMERAQPLLFTHALSHELARCVFISYAAANPVFGITAYLARVLFSWRLRMHHYASRQALDAKVLAVTA